MKQQKCANDRCWMNGQTNEWWQPARNNVGGFVMKYPRPVFLLFALLIMALVFTVPVFGNDALDPGDQTAQTYENFLLPMIAPDLQPATSAFVGNLPLPNDVGKIPTDAPVPNYPIAHGITPQERDNH